MLYKKPLRILVTIVGQGSVVYIIRTGILEAMQTFCVPVVSMLWDDESLRSELTKKGIENHVIPSYSVSNYYSDLRTKINVWYNNKILKSPSTKIQAAYLSKYTSTKKRVRNAVKTMLTSIRHNFPAYTANLISKEQAAIKSEPLYAVYKKWLENINIDGIYTITPFMQEVELLAKICKEKGQPIISCVHSFDNITKRGWPAIFFDHYIVWNKYNKNELERINPSLKQDKITIAGAPQFDFHFSNESIETKDEWMERMKLPTGKKIILYGGGPAILFPDEPQYLKDLHAALSKDVIKNAVILFRSHPLDKMERWKKMVGESPYIIYDKAPNGTVKLDYTNVTGADVQQLISTLKYTDVHINLCSTMAVDGSVFKRPQIAPAYDCVRPAKQHLLRKMYYQEHYLPIMQSKNVHLALSRQELIDLVNSALDSPELMTANAEACVKEIITYTDGNAAKRVSEILETFFNA